MISVGDYALQRTCLLADDCPVLEIIGECPFLCANYEPNLEFEGW